MSPAQQRYVFGAFVLMIAGVTANVMLLQPAHLATTQGRAGTAESKAELDRRQRLALEQSSAEGHRDQQAQLEQLVRRAVTSTSNGGSDGGLPAPARPTGRMQPTATQIPMEQGPRRFARLRPDATQAPAVDRLPDAPDAEGDPEVIKAVQRELTQRGYGPLVTDGMPGLVTRAAIMAFEADNRMPLTGEATTRLLSRLHLSAAAAAALPDDPAAGKVRSPEAELVIRTVQQSLAALGYQAGRVDGRVGEEVSRAISEFELDEGLKPTGRVSAEVFARLGRVVAAARPKPAQ